MSAGRRDLVVIMLAVAGLVGAISLAGIFVVYLVDTIGDDGSKSTQNAGATGATAPGVASSGDGTPAPGAPTPAAPSGTPAKPGNAGTQPKGKPGAGPGLNVIPKDQKFATYRNASVGYSILYPKGWNKSGNDKDVHFVHNNNFLRISVTRGKPPNVADVRRNLRRNKAVTLPGGSGNPGVVNIKGQRVVKDTLIQKAVLQRTPQGPIRSVVDQYRFAKGGKVAVVDLGTTTRVRPRNADDFRKIAESFRFQ
jgi:hypothetical protein